MALNRWWAGSSRERFWLESTDRPDLGSDLRAPLTDNRGRDNWRYTIAREARVGDIVFHYDKRAKAITAVSRVAGPPVEAPIVWAARGTSARGRHAMPQRLPGYRVALDRYEELSQPLTLRRLREAKTLLRELKAKVSRGVRGPLYFPFELADREVRPLQGYAFKLPADFVDAFGELRGVVEQLEPGTELLSETELFSQAMAAMEAAAPRHAIGQLQAERASRLGLKRVSKKLFSAAGQSSDWAFHHGGRGEVQFNIGLDQNADGSRALRAGLAFSFELSRSLPDIDVFLGRVERFNAWMREYPEAYGDLAMWHYQDRIRSPDRACGPIAEGLVRPGVFIFVGDRQRLGAVDTERALETFDRLLPLYRWVESDTPQVPEAMPGASRGREILQLDKGRDIDGGRWITASVQARTLDVFLRHAEVQRRLKAALQTEGCDLVVTEAPIGQRCVDLVARRGQELWFYEVKIASSVRACLREAIGQLLEYGLWPGATRPARLVVVGEHPLDSIAREYLEVINARFPIPLEYRQLRLAGSLSQR
jgi:hypothetical protein